MGSNNKRSSGLSRRTVLGGIGGTGIASLAGLPAVTARAGDGPTALETDTHTRDTFRSIVDAIVPETPGLADELGSEHEPGGLDVDLEEFLIWNYDNSEELRAEGLSWLVASALSIDVGETDLEEILEDVRDDHSTIEGHRVRRTGLTDVETVFGSLRGLEIDVERPSDEGSVGVEYAITTTEESVDGESVTYPYAPVFAAIFDLVALEFVARGEPEDDVEARSAFDGGGAFVYLSPRDRLRCLEWLFGGEPVEILEDELSELIAAPETMPDVVMTLQILTVMGYYSEWAGYGETKTDPPTERDLETPIGEVQSRQQTGYPGLEPGYAAYRGVEVSEFRENDY